MVYSLILNLQFGRNFNSPIYAYFRFSIFATWIVKSKKNKMAIDVVRTLIWIRSVFGNAIKGDCDYLKLKSMLKYAIGDFYVIPRRKANLEPIISLWIILMFPCKLWLSMLHGDHRESLASGVDTKSTFYKSVPTDNVWVRDEVKCLS